MDPNYWPDQRDWDIVQPVTPGSNQAANDGCNNGYCDNGGYLPEMLDYSQQFYPDFPQPNFERPGYQRPEFRQPTAEYAGFDENAYPPSPANSQLAPGDQCESKVSAHIVAIQENLTKNNITDWRFSIHSDGPNCFRRYWLGRKLRDDDRSRLAFLQVFNPGKHHNAVLPNYRFNMTLAYEPRQFMHSDTYPAIGEHEQDGGDQVRYDDHDVSDLSAYNPPVPTLMASPEPHHGLEIPATPETARLPSPAMPTPKNEPECRTPPSSRVKSILKPERDPAKNLDGKFICTWQGCNEDLKEFSRKCEWNKHMDKHDRPYKCQVEGCEKLPGFTYSGGLLRHEREVHGKHGGPKNPINCPHPNCKRHHGKGFSRLENLNEHLRRVHTNNPGATGSPSEEPEDNAGMGVGENVVIGEKRKVDDDLRDEVKRLRAENQKLRNEVLAQRTNQAAMMDEIRGLQDQLGLSGQQLPNVPSAPTLDDLQPHF